MATLGGHRVPRGQLCGSHSFAKVSTIRYRGRGCYVFEKKYSPLQKCENIYSALVMCEKKSFSFFYKRLCFTMLVYLERHDNSDSKIYKAKYYLVKSRLGNVSERVT